MSDEPDISALVLVEWDYYVFLQSCQKKLADMKITVSSKEMDKSGEDKIKVVDISADAQRGFGQVEEASLVENEANKFRTPVPGKIPISEAVLTSSQAQPERFSVSTNLYTPRALKSRFIEHIKPKAKGKANKILEELLNHPDIVFWDETGDLTIRGIRSGNLNVLLPRCFYGPRSHEANGEMEWLALLKELNLYHLVTNKSPFKVKRKPQLGRGDETETVGSSKAKRPNIVLEKDDSANIALEKVDSVQKTEDSVQRTNEINETPLEAVPIVVSEK